MTLKFDENGLIPAIIQDAQSKDVLMLGYMNQEAYDLTIETNRVTFYSRSKSRIWVKGEQSENYLNLVDIKLDCDQDALLVTAKPDGPTCHKGTKTCWGDTESNMIDYLENTFKDRIENPSTESYVSSLIAIGINKVAQKVGEEAVEIVIESKDDNRELFLNEAADLFFHYLLLLNVKDCAFDEVLKVLEARKK